MHQASGVSPPQAGRTPRLACCWMLWYSTIMKHSETPSPASYIGHVKNGVIIVDAKISLQDGQAVRVEPLAPSTETPVDAERTARVSRLKQLFTEWTDEDATLSNEEADRLQNALEENCGLQFRSPKLD